MAASIYPKYKAAMRTKSSNAYDLSSGSVTVKAALIDTGTTTYSTAHQFYSDISGAVVGTPVALTTKTVSSLGVFDADNVTFTSVSGGGGTKDILEAVVLYVDTGNAATSPLIAYIDSASITGLPVTPNGGDITITWNASGIFD